MFKSRKYELTHLIFIIVWLIICWFTIPKITAHQSKPIKVTVYEIHTVMPGETLWSIATMYKHDDIRRLVYDIQKASDTTAAIRIGQELKIPIEGR